jgi:hypothetical protein
MLEEQEQGLTPIAIRSAKKKRAIKDAGDASLSRRLLFFGFMLP